MKKIKHRLSRKDITKRLQVADNMQQQMFHMADEAAVVIDQLLKVIQTSQLNETDRSHADYIIGELRNDSPLFRHVEKAQSPAQKAADEGLTVIDEVAEIPAETFQNIMVARGMLDKQPVPVPEA